MARFADLEPEKFVRKDPRAFVGPTGKLRYFEMGLERITMPVEQVALKLIAEGFEPKRGDIKSFTVENGDIRVYIQTVEA